MQVRYLYNVSFFRIAFVTFLLHRTLLMERDNNVDVSKIREKTCNACEYDFVQYRSCMVCTFSLQNHHVIKMPLLFDGK